MVTTLDGRHRLHLAVRQCISQRQRSQEFLISCVTFILSEKRQNQSMRQIVMFVKTLHTTRKVCVPPAIYKSVSDFCQGSGQFVGVLGQTYSYAEVIVQVG
jgi:hypothetical protein